MILNKEKTQHGLLVSAFHFPAIYLLHEGFSGDHSITTDAVKKHTVNTTMPFAQPYDHTVISPANCNNNMAGYTIPLDSIRKSAPLSYAKSGVSPIPNFHDVKYKDDNPTQGDDDFIYTEDDLKGCAALNDFCETDSSALNYIVYSHMNVDYDKGKLPCIIIFHAGGFSDCSTYKYEDSLCYAMARKGFVVFNVEYRRGRIKDTIELGKYTSVQQMLAIYRAFQDGRGAIRSIIKRQFNIANNHLPYQIDTNHIFVVGQSAGASIANQLAYYTDQAMIDSIFPVPAGEPSFSAALGPINADYYFGDTSIEYHSKIKGLCSMWGGFPIPMVNNNSIDEYKFLTRGYKNPLIPFIGFMGIKDPVFPYEAKKQKIYYPPDDTSNAKYVIETNCLLIDTMKININQNNKPNLRMECTNDIFTILKDNGNASLQYIDTSMGHGLSKPDSLNICHSDFGVAGDLTLNQVNEYLASRFCFYFQSILNGTEGALGGIRKFIFCEDYRHSPDASGNCATAADHDCP